MSHADDEVLVRVEGVSKRFCRNLKRSLRYGVEDTLGDLLGGADAAPKLRRDEFWAVDDVSFELKRGECLGLIGRNGAGKTTLLKMLNGLIKPDKGRIEMHGRVGALIALGAGFNPILTGRENIYVNGSVLGFSKREIDAKLDEIIDFAEIVDFIDAPVQSYSSGMQVRLGFAVASNINPDILLVDEVLAVGDAGFRIKCYNKLFEIRDRTATILVSHSMPQIGKVCTTGLLLQSGRTLGETAPIAEAIQSYLDQFEGPGLSREGNGAVVIEQIRMRQGRAQAHMLYSGQRGDGCVRDIDPAAETILELECVKKGVTGPIVILWTITDAEQKSVAQAMSDVLASEPNTERLRISTKIKALDMNSGRYTLSVHVFESRAGRRHTILAGLRDFAGFSVQRPAFAGTAPILYANETEATAATGLIHSTC